VREGGWDYFIANRGDKRVERWITLGRPAKSVAVLDPRFDREGEVAGTRPSGSGATEVYLQLDPGESRILRLSTTKELHGSFWSAIRERGEPIPITGTWNVKFIEGGPALPESFTTVRLGSWTDRADPEAKRFAGTARYEIEFEMPVAQASDWLLDLGTVCESARVRVNGRNVATLWCAPFRVPVGGFLRPGKNTLEVDIANLAANRIADLDRRGVNWKSFHEINFVNKEYKPFDASKWPLRGSGLLGPVRLIPVTRVRPNHPF
jgi:hypothetical protein